VLFQPEPRWITMVFSRSPHFSATTTGGGGSALPVLDSRNARALSVSLGGFVLPYSASTSSWLVTAKMADLGTTTDMLHQCSSAPIVP